MGSSDNLKPEKEESGRNHSAVGLDMAKNVFHCCRLGRVHKVYAISLSAR
ncbi:hypothetical protein B0F88_113104 [Methylobacter tundripaludum]|uniref:Uncharacterized protein n=1 Tax=Methylobacter tundripaludum TaxID=173365 RepID=A0A2S6GRA9_9GAMM|nr:hypothetical protein B0F88_113104 [Methylobacter tundripaludum]